MIKSAKKEYFIFLLVFYVIILRDAFTNSVPFLGYLDELFALLAVPIGIVNFFKKKQIQVEGFTKYIVFFVVFGCFSSLIYKYQNVIVSMSDLLVNVKFWLSIYVSKNLFANLNLKWYGKKLGQHIKLVVWFYIILIALSYAYEDLFYAEIRYGLKSVQLFYGIHSVFCAMCVFLVALLTVIKDEVKNSKLYIAVLLLLIASTLRTKAFGAILMYLLMYYLVFLRKKKIKLSTFAVMGIAAVFIGWSQIQYYFVENDTARDALLRKCFVVAKDHFPLGSGFATFGSYYSGVEYSPLYFKYGMSKIWGLTAEKPDFISDSFWPMIIAQFGYIGMIIFIIAIFKLISSIGKVKDIDVSCYFGALYSVSYLCISSFAETAFVHYISVPLAIVIGCCLSRKNQICTQDIFRREIS